MFLYLSECNLGFIGNWLTVWLFEQMSTQHVNHGVNGTVFSLVYVSLKEFGVVGSDTCTWGIKDFHKCWLGSLAKRRLCLGPADVINCTPLSALSFWVSLFRGTRGYNISIRGPQPLVPRHLFLGRKVMTNLDSIFKNRDITLPTKVHLVKGLWFFQ